MHHVTLWSAWVGIETAIFWQCSSGTVETQRLYPLHHGPRSGIKVWFFGLINLIICSPYMVFHCRVRTESKQVLLITVSFTKFILSSNIIYIHIYILWFYLWEFFTMIWTAWSRFFLWFPVHPVSFLSPWPLFQARQLSPRLIHLPPPFLLSFWYVSIF